MPKKLNVLPYTTNTSISYLGTVIPFTSIDDFKDYSVRLYQKHLYRFDENGVYRCYPVTDVQSDPYDSDNLQIHVTVKTGETFHYTPIWIFDTTQPALPKVIDSVIIHLQWFRLALRTLIPDQDTIDECIMRYNDMVQFYQKNRKADNFDELLRSYINKKYPYINDNQTLTHRILANEQVSPEVYRFILRVNRPVFQLMPENTNRNTFDFVRCYLSVPTKDSHPNRISFIREHKQEIIAVALQSIARTKKFQSYGVPINILKLELFTLTKQSELELVFGIKQV